jgi:hydroxyacylglutathione hydrolase
VATLKEEKEPNTLMLLRNPSFIYQLRESFPDLPAEPDAKTVSKKLRKLRNAC